MALDNDHKVTMQGLRIYYTYEAKPIVVNHVLALIYRITRRATKNYKYVGLSESEAKAGVEAKTTQYTRTKKGWYYDGEDDQFKYRNMTAIQAQISANHFGGHLWEVVIQVDETDEVWTDEIQGSLASYFNITPHYDE